MSDPSPSMSALSSPTISSNGLSRRKKIIIGVSVSVAVVVMVAVALLVYFFVLKPKYYDPSHDQATPIIVGKSYPMSTFVNNTDQYYLSQPSQAQNNSVDLTKATTNATPYAVTIIPPVNVSSSTITNAAVSGQALVEGQRFSIRATPKTLDTDASDPYVYLSYESGSAQWQRYAFRQSGHGRLDSIFTFYFQRLKTDGSCCTYTTPQTVLAKTGYVLSPEKSANITMAAPEQQDGKGALYLVSEGTPPMAYWMLDV